MVVGLFGSGCSRVFQSCGVIKSSGDFKSSRFSFCLMPSFGLTVKCILSVVFVSNEAMLGLEFPLKLDSVLFELKVVVWRIIFGLDFFFGLISGFEICCNGFRKFIFDDLIQ